MVVGWDLHPQGPLTAKCKHRAPNPALGWVRGATRQLWGGHTEPQGLSEEASLALWLCLAGLLLARIQNSAWSG